MKSDQELRADVLDELKWDSRVQANQIGVIAKDGAITLTGTVQSYAEKMAAEHAAKRVKGVRAIAQDIEVKLPDEMRRSDEGIAERIARLLQWNSTLRDTSILAEVRNGFVTLTGEVNWPHQRHAAVRRVEELQGVVGVSNYIKVRDPIEQVSSRDIAKQITRALHRHATNEASRVLVSVTNGKVVLDGTVDTYADRDLIADAVWATSGVNELIDNLRVG